MATANNRASWLRGPVVSCLNVPQRRRHPFHIVLLGAPGVGKGTQAQLLAQRIGACALCTGDIFRTACLLADCQRSPAMNEALRAMRAGKLVPDQTVLQLVRERKSCLNCGGGFILDGFPRTTAQARALDELLAELEITLDAVLDFRCPNEELIVRLSGRRVCPDCKAVYHITQRPPQKLGTCDTCGGALQQRDDDLPDAIRVRLETYHDQTAPLTDYYARRGVLAPVDASGSPDQVLQQAIEALWMEVEV